MGEFYRPAPEEMEKLNKPEQQAAMEQRITQAEPPGPEMNKLSPNYQIEHKEAVAPQEFKETPPQPPPGDIGGQRQDMPQQLKEAPQPNDKIGAQAQDTPQYNQGHYPDCALQSARMVEAKQLGKDPGLDAYKNEAKKQENYGPGGVNDMEKFSEQINERPGLKAGYKEGGSLDEIKSNLDQGKSVIAGVDARTFYPEHEFPPNEAPGHAIVVTGAEKGPDGHYNITVNDPNDHSGNRVIPEQQFLDSWNKFGNPMIVVEKSGGKA